jgi:hypothetical protein
VITPTMHSYREGFRFSGPYTNPGAPDYYFYDDPVSGTRKPATVLFERKKEGLLEVRDSSVPVVNKGDGKSKQPVLKETPSIKLTPAVVANWQLLVAQFFSVNWLLFCINLLPAFPLDGGRILQALLWHRGDSRSATVTAVFAGFLTMLVMGVYSIAVQEVLPFMLAIFVYVMCRQQLVRLEQAEEPSQLGYDFSQGYASLEREAPPQPPPPKPGPIQRLKLWWTERRLKREQERRDNEERRLDELLDKIHREGKEALSDEERRFLERVSLRRSHKR